MAISAYVWRLGADLSHRTAEGVAFRRQALILTNDDDDPSFGWDRFLRSDQQHCMAFIAKHLPLYSLKDSGTRWTTGHTA